MRLAREASRVVGVLLIAFLLIGIVGPVKAFGQSSQQASAVSTQTPTPQQASAVSIQPVIDRAEESFRRGEEALSKGLPDIARKMFDTALDTVLQLGVDLKSDPKLAAYYRNLLDRIHKHEAQPGISTKRQIALKWRSLRFLTKYRKSRIPSSLW
jgi:hypothetical protein